MPNSTRAWQLRVTRAGLVCSLGLDATTACAAANAGLSRAGVLRTVNVGADLALAGEPVFGHALPCGRADGFAGFAKAMLLGRLALEDLARRHVLPSPGSTGLTGLYLALSDRYLQDRAALAPEMLEPDEEAPPAPSLRWRADAARLGERLSSEPAARHLGIGGCRVLLGGHTAFARALDDAAQHLATGRVVRAFVAAVDCCIEPTELRAAAITQRLKTAERAVGHIPGEAGVCLAVELAEAGAIADPKGTDSIVVGGLGLARTTSDAPAHERGRALADAMLAAVAGWPTSAAASGWDLASDLNGDPRRADEWGHCAVAWQAAGAGALGAPECIAATIGECGAAGVAAQIALLLHRAGRGRRSLRPTLLPLSSDDGERAALVAN